MNLIDEAAFYVSLGWSIFPLSPGTKVPFKGSHGLDDATDDADVIAEWHRRDPHSNISAHAKRSGLLVVDIDCKRSDGPNGFDTIEQLMRRGKILPRTVTSRTRSGGEHRYYRVDPGVRWTLSLKQQAFPGIDLLAGNTGIILPPSVIDAKKARDGIGGQYEWISAPLGPHLPLVPKWLLEVYRPAPARPRPSSGYQTRVTQDAAEKWIDALCRRVFLAPSGQGNGVLNSIAHAAGRFAPEMGVDGQYVEKRLLEASTARGRPIQECISTIRCAMREGAKKAGGNSRA